MNPEPALPLVRRNIQSAQIAFPSPGGEGQGEGERHSRSLTSRFAFRISIFVFLCLLTLTVTAAPRPNIVLIFTDNVGMNDLSCYGSEIPTPHTDRIAREGARFTHWYTASSICTPSRFGLLTGRYPNRSQDQLLTALMPTTARDDDRGIRPPETTIAGVLKQQGYRTAIIGKWHLGHGDKKFLPTQHGFDSFFGFTGGCIDYFTLKYGDKPTWYRDQTLFEGTGYATDLLSDEAVKFIEQQTPGQPFFLYLPHNSPHYGKSWDAENKKYLNLLQPHPKYLKLVEHIPAGPRRDYAAMMAGMDTGIGRLLDALQRKGLGENTLMMCLSDNGAMTEWSGSNHPFRGRISDPLEGGVRVPCVMRWPGKIKPGTLIHQPCSSLDIFPTLCHLTGASTNGLTLDGLDITPVLLEGKEFPRDLFWSLGPYDGDAFIRGPWKYVRFKREGEMLFHLPSDPGEKWNLAKEHPAIFTELKSAHTSLATKLGIQLGKRK
ncbi:MAG: sulfatase-like hydrolase/transferase [Verrucomicrobiota bacterium]